MLTFGGDLMGEAIEYIAEETRCHRFPSLTKVEEELSAKFNCSASTADARLRRALDMAEFRCGVYPNPELEKLQVTYRIDKWTVKKFIYAAAREVMYDEWKFM